MLLLLSNWQNLRFGAPDKDFKSHIISTEGIWSPELLVGFITSYLLLPTVQPLMHQVLVDYFVLLSSGFFTYARFL